VDFTTIIERIEALGVSEWMRTSLKAMPVVEAIHVMAVALLFGTILIVDLRLLGWPDTRRSFTTVSRELLGMTWVAFGIAVIAGLLMFAPNASTYFDNTPFRLKMLALLGAGVNMVVFQLITVRTVADWDRNAPAPLAGRVAGAASILIWTSMIFLGRWIGFTKGYDFEIPENIELDFEFLLDSALPSSGAQK
jgi:hypothetical protein